MVKNSSQSSIHQIACHCDVSSFDGDVVALFYTTHKKIKKDYSTVVMLCFFFEEEQSATKLQQIFRLDEV